MPDTAPLRLNHEARDDRFPQSWYPMALAREVAPGALIGVDFLGTRVILYRDADGRPVVQSAYCPHLGADLSLGQMVDRRVRCPFHHWSFAADGRCAHVPTGDKIPPGAVIATYPSAEAWGLIWAFNGTTPLFPPPRIPDTNEADLVFESNLWGPRPVDSWLSVSNGVDFQHLRTLHNLPAEPPEMVEVGPYGLEYQAENPSYSQHGLVTGTNCFAQHIHRAAGDAWMLFTGRAVAPRRSMSYYVVGVSPGAGAEQRLAAVKAFTIRLIEEDAPILNTIRFRKGTLVASDRSLARFFKYVEDFPVASALDG
ncbi:MAG TPA: Rieske (2Fe-2S) protein [Stellaceae bacterium]|nr:Rieske (2Fe-2S) protein [Stellaceae bacterium]